MTDTASRPVHTLTLKLEDEHRRRPPPPSAPEDVGHWLREFPEAWAETGGTGLAEHGPRSPLRSSRVQNRSGFDSTRCLRRLKKNYTTHRAPPGPRGLATLLVGLERPLLPGRKPNSNDYRPVQDLGEVSKRVADIHPTVPHPDTLLGSLPPNHTWCTAPDLKDAFFSWPLAPRSQDFFAFKWADPGRGPRGHLTGARLPRGLKNSPALPDEALHGDLGEFCRSHPNPTLLQYTDDLLIVADDQETCPQRTKALLQTLGDLGYRASAKKAQSCKPQVSSLGYLLKDGQRWLSQAGRDSP